MAARERTGEDGYLLLGLVVTCFILLLALGVAAPRVAKQLERDREVESEHRAQQYVRAIQLYYRRNNSFPSSVEQLAGQGQGGLSLGGASTAVKYLRAKYTDPLTKDEFRLIHAGEAQTQVKGFFGEPLEGMPVGNLGAAAGMVSNLGGASSQGASQAGVGQAGTGIAAPGAASPTSPTGGFGASSGTSGSTSATAFQGSKGAIVGVGSNAKGQGLVEWNGSETIEAWEFLYDPRVEILKAKVSIFGGTPAASGSGFAPASGTTFGGSSGAGTSSSSGGSGTSSSGSGTNGTTK